MRQPLSIAVVCYPTLGGSGVIAVELAAGLAERGHRVHLIASAPPSRPLPQHDRLSMYEVAVGDYPLLEHLPYDLAVAAKLVELAEGEGLDLVHVHYAVPHCASAYLARQTLGARAPRVVTTLHGTDVTRFGADARYRAVVAFTVAASDGLTVPSEFLRGAAHQYLGIAATRPIEVIPNFVDTDYFTPAVQRDRRRFAEFFRDVEDGPVLFHVSNFRPVKRATDLIEVLVRVRRRLRARLVLVGDGPEREAVEKQARALGVTRCVHFLGHRLDFVDYLKHADAFLLTSQSESFGVAALEALSAGVPVVAYRVGGLSELVPADAGHLVQPFDAGALAAAAIDVIEDDKRRVAYGQAARAHAVARFQRAPAIAHYESYFRQILGHTTPEPT